MKKLLTLILFFYVNASAFATLTITPSKSSYIGNYNISSKGGHDGWILISVTGGTGPYTYLWRTYPFTTNYATGLYSGTYKIVVTDSIGTSDSVSVTMTEPSKSLSVSLTKTDISCHGLTDGSITATVSGGTPAYTIVWNSSAVDTGSTLTGLSAGVDSILVTDANGITVGGSATITEPTAMALSFYSPVYGNGFNLSSGHNDGSIQLTASGGTQKPDSPYYNFQWSNGPFTKDISNLAAGKYVVQVTDNHSCVKTDSIFLSSEDSLSPDAVPFNTRGNRLNASEDFIGTINASALVVKTKNTERMRIDTIGNVGIGIDTPRVKLDVNGEVRITGKIKSDSLSFAPDSLDYTPDSAQYYRLVGTNSEGQLTSFRFPVHGGPIGPHDPIECGITAYGPATVSPYWKSDQANRVLSTYCPDTKVGIGTSSPGARLEIVDGNQSLQFLTGTNTSGYIASIGVNNDGVNIANNSSSRGFNFSNASATLMTITYDGKVGIGITPSTYQLDVSGTMRACEIRVNTGGCDFVFEKNYQLRSLHELEAFILKNKHLPEIAPAKEMESGSVAVGEMQSKLLQKVEELTLYIIQQDKRIEELERKQEKK